MIGWTIGWIGCAQPCIAFFLFLYFKVLATHLSLVVLISSVWVDILVLTLVVSICISTLYSLLQLAEENEASSTFSII